MIVQQHGIHVGESLKEEITLNLPVGAEILYVHHFGLPHGWVEVVETHLESLSEETAPRRLIVIDTFCSGAIKTSYSRLRFIITIQFDNHVWNFFEILE